MSPSMIRWGDTVRAYGFGVFLILVTCAMLWRFLERPVAARFVVAALAAIASVHVLYYNAVLLFAFCARGLAVCVALRAWKQAVALVSIGGRVAIALAVYVPLILQMQPWN